MNITLVYSSIARNVREWTLEVEMGCTASNAIEIAGVIAEFPELRAGALKLGVWGKPTDPAEVLASGDRIEIYRGLKVDPKVARRERFKRQGAKGTGLFSELRAGAKAGY